ncbi:C-type mannose receptor 2 [Holothuria leucospilota]|uniref:C-type mannose receptor 2 n=1 Tax=Holothuria leucospilota TaxID=206669 RepID=A0A9Q1GWK3_HOLLE|nr:C-type mannose receptor 2 [Holothuria leucospilota]
MAYKFYSTLCAVFLAMLLPIVAVGAGADNDRSCPHYGVNFRGRCFWFVDVRTTWYEAGHLCHRLYGDRVTLVTIKDKETNDFIRSQWHRAFWIGLHEAHGETIWRWVDNTEPANGNYQNWDGGATPPLRTGPRNCGGMPYDSDLWTDFDCGSRLFSVCAELPSAPICPNGGIFFRDRCYWRGNRQLSWADANQACQDEFGQETRLAVARDAETNLFLSRLAGRNIWLGLSDIKEEGVWKWIDGAPLEYRNWASPVQPDNWRGMEDCGEIRYPSAQWNDASCGDPYPGSSGNRWTLSYICAVPPCYETTENDGDELVTVSNEEVQIIDHSICARTECTERCVNGGACNSTGQCVCVQQFSGMTCNLDEWKVELENEIVNTTTGSTINLKCKVNLPVDHISSLTWTKCEPGFLPQYRHTITNVLSQGYSILQVTDLLLEDAGEYHCKVVLSFRDTETPVVKSVVVDVTEASTPVPTTKLTTDRNTTAETQTSRPISLTNSASERTTTKETSSQATTTKPKTEKISTKEPKSSVTAKQISTERTPTRVFEGASVSSSERTADSPTKENKRTRNALVQNTGGYGKASPDASKHSAHQPAGGPTALIVILIIMATLLLVTVVVLMMKMRRMERESSGDGKLIELQDKF